jgi:hypothetical protein
MGGFSATATSLLERFHATGPLTNSLLRPVADFLGDLERLLGATVPSRCSKSNVDRRPAGGLVVCVQI